MTWTQNEFFCSISTPLGTDKLILGSFSGEEGISEPFHYRVDASSEDTALDFTQVVGQNATVKLRLPDGSDRYLNGVVTRFVQGATDEEFTNYSLELRPWLWMLTLTRGCRIFQQKTVPEIIEAVFTDLGYTDYKNSLTGTYTQREYCVQYRESAFDFVSRLMEEEGIFYFFEHAEDAHTLVLADDASAHVVCPGQSTMRYGNPKEAEGDEDVISDCTFGQQVTVGKYAVDDFNFETPSTDLDVSVDGQYGTLEVYEYPGGHTATDAGEAVAQRRIEAFELPVKQLQGRSNCRAFAAGYKFTFSAHQRDSVNGDYVLQRVLHWADQINYANEFEAFPADVPFRPLRGAPKPVIPGTQTALVVGKSGEEIWTDEYGRVKVQFHWDREGQSDENSSCWVRVAQGWAGQQWGSFFLPRIGQEVVVSFLDGDPDRPLVTGSVYNAEKTVPYTLPDDQTKSTIKSKSSKQGDGFNEIRFEDKKDSEEIYVHAAKDYNRETLNNETVTVTTDRTVTVKEGNESLTVSKGDRTVKVETGKETHEVKGTRALTVTDNETHTNKADFTHEVTGNYSLKVSGDLTIEVTGAVTIKGASVTIQSTSGEITVKASTALTNQAGTELTTKSGTALNVKAGTELTAEGGVGFTVKGSASGTVDGGGMLTVKGGMVKIN